MKHETQSNSETSALVDSGWLSIRAQNVLANAFGRVPKRRELRKLLIEKRPDRPPYITLRMLNNCGRETASEICAFYRMKNLDDGKRMSPATGRHLARVMREVLDEAKGMTEGREAAAFLAWKGLVGRVENWVGARLELEP